MNLTRINPVLLLIGLAFGALTVLGALTLFDPEAVLDARGDQQQAAPTQAGLQVRATTVSLEKGTAADCPDDWRFLDNAADRYTLCLPPGWEASDGTASDPLSPSPESLRGGIFFSGDLFPHSSEPGNAPLPNAPLPDDAANRLAAAASRVRISVVQPGLRFERCTPARAISIGSAQGRYCEESYSIDSHGMAQFLPSGNLHAIKILLPHPNAAATLSLPGYPGQPASSFQLYLKVVTAADGFAARSALLWQLLGTVKVY